MAGLILSEVKEKEIFCKNEGLEFIKELLDPIN